MICNYIFRWSNWLMDIEQYYRLQQIIDRNQVAAIAIYVVITVITCVVLAMPGVTYAMIGSFLFGPLLGTVYCVIAVSLGAGASFLIARFFLKEELKLVVSKNKYINKFLFEEARKNDFIIIMITRLVPIFPFNLQNFAYGITEISFRNYMIYSFIFMIPGTAMYTFGAAGILDSENRVLYLGIAVTLSMIVIGSGILIKKRYIK